MAKIPLCLGCCSCRGSKSRGLLVTRIISCLRVYSKCRQSVAPTRSASRGCVTTWPCCCKIVHKRLLSMQSSRYSRRLNGVSLGLQVVLFLAQLGVHQVAVRFVVGHGLLDLGERQVKVVRHLFRAESVDAHPRNKLPDRHMAATQPELASPGIRPRNEVFVHILAPPGAGRARQLHGMR